VLERQAITDVSERNADERILDAALVCFARSGFHGATMQQIALEAGVSKALVHYHFQTKDQLLVEVQSRSFLRLAEKIAALGDAGSPSVDRGLAALDRVWELLVATRDQIPFNLEMWSESSRRPELRERLMRFTAQMLALIERGVRQTLGPVADRLAYPPDRLARVLLAILSGLGTHAHFAPGLEVADETYRDLRLLLERALRWEEAP
jgi:AcrR family transcriptional regulator